MSEQKKKRQRIYDLLNAETELKTISEITGVSLWLPSGRDLNALVYALCGVLENKTSHPNIGSFKNAIGEEWNKISEDMQFVPKACWYNNWKKKWWSYRVNLLFCFFLLIL